MQRACRRLSQTISFIRFRSSASQFLVPNNSSTILGYKAVQRACKRLSLTISFIRFRSSALQFLVPINLLLIQNTHA